MWTKLSACFAGAVLAAARCRCSSTAIVFFLFPAFSSVALDFREVSLKAFDGITANDNSPAQIAAELFKPKVFQCLAAVTGAPSNKWEMIQLKKGQQTNTLVIYEVADSGDAFNKLAYQVACYITDRSEGHTATYVLASLTNRPPPLLSDRMLSILASEYPKVPLPLLRLIESTNYVIPSGTVSNIFHIAGYALTDGEITWEYGISFNPKTKSSNVSIPTRHDSREYDPQYVPLIKRVLEEVPRSNYSWIEMDRRFKELGLRTFSELNPHYPKHTDFYR